MGLSRITSGALAANAVTAAKIADGTISATDLGTIYAANVTGLGSLATASSVANTQITGNIIASQLQPTGVTAGVYGNATIIPVVTVDVQGRLTSVANTAVSLGTMATQNASSVAITGGSATLTTLKETKVAIAASDIDLSLGNFFNKTISGTTTLTVSNVPSANTAVSFVLELTNGGSQTVNWFGNVKWAGGTAPSLTSSGKDSIGFYTFDGGSNWNGFKLGLDIK